MRLCAVKRRLLLRETTAAKRVVRIKIPKVQVCDVRGECAERTLLDTLATTQHGGAEALKLAGFPLLERLWSRSKALPTAQKRASARNRLSAQARKGWGVSLLARPLLRTCATMPRGVVRVAADKVFTALGRDTRPQVQRLWKRMRTIVEAPDQVGKMLCDWRAWSRDTYVPGTMPRCTCKGLIECGDPANIIDGHLAMRGRSYKGPGARALWCSEKTPIAAGTRPVDVRHQVWTAVRGLVRSMPARIRDEVTDAVINEAVCAALAAQTCQPETTATQANGKEPTRADVLAVKERFEHQVISLIDKERGELCVMCPITQYRVMESAFPRDDGRFEVLDPSQEYRILCDAIDHATQEGWESNGDLYGTEWRARRKGEPRPPRRGGKRKKVRVPGTCEIARGYGTIKGKSWRAKPQPVVKGRPITPHTKHVLKRISNTMARAHHTWLCAINDSIAARLWETQQYKHRLEQARARVLQALRVLVPEAELCDVGMVWLL